MDLARCEGYPRPTFQFEGHPGHFPQNKRSFSFLQIHFTIGPFMQAAYARSRELRFLAIFGGPLHFFRVLDRLDPLLRVSRPFFAF